MQLLCTVAFYWIFYGVLVSSTRIWLPDILLLSGLSTSSKRPTDGVGGRAADIVAGCSVELRVGMLRGSYGSGMLRRTPHWGAAGFLGSPVIGSQK